VISRDPAITELPRPASGSRGDRCQAASLVRQRCGRRAIPKFSSGGSREGIPERCRAISVSRLEGRTRWRNGPSQQGARPVACRSASGVVARHLEAGDVVLGDRLRAAVGRRWRALAACVVGLSVREARRASPRGSYSRMKTTQRREMEGGRSVALEGSPPPSQRFGCSIVARKRRVGRRLADKRDLTVEGGRSRGGLRHPNRVVPGAPRSAPAPPEVRLISF
jgi:hypothetical protein